MDFIEGKASLRWQEASYKELCKSGVCVSGFPWKLGDEGEGSQTSN